MVNKVEYIIHLSFVQRDYNINDFVTVDGRDVRINIQRRI